jgi:hypothetical protein
MSRIALFLGILVFVTTVGAIQASADVGEGNAHSFAWFRDADGDGIPNGMDDDWFPPEDGDGYQVRNGFGLFGLGLFLGTSGGENSYGPQYRFRKDRPETPGDFLRIRQHLRDGSCE